MISKHEISSGAGAASYFANSFSKDGAAQTDNYYVNERAQATWAGSAAQILGVAGKRVDRDDFVAFLDGKLRNPATGEIQDLTQNSKGADRRAGWDFTVSAPKSVSIVGLIGSDGRIMQAHRVANATAMAWLERHGAQIRVKDGNGQNVKEATGNLIYATVTHETSRDNEPQIHNHNVIIAATYDARRGKWRSLTNDELFKLRSDGDVVYKAALAKELRKAGYELEYAKDGVNFEIKGVEPQQLETFSSRTKAIDAALTSMGVDPQSASWVARQNATLGTRAKKDEIPRQTLHKVWQDTARSAGLDVSHLVRASEKRAANPEHINTLQEAETKAALESVSWAVEHLSSREQSFKLAELEKTAIEFGRVSHAAVQDAIRSHTKGGLLVVRDEVQDGMTLMTTFSAITAERQMQANIKDGIDRGRVVKPVLSSESEFNASLQAFESGKSKTFGVEYKLTGEQIHAAKNMLMHPDAYQAIQGDAGTGKTAVLEFVREVAQAKGWLVRGVAVSASAAQELQASSGIESQTLAGMFAERETAARQINLEITALKAAIAMTAVTEKPLQKGEHAAASAPRIEVQRLAAHSADIDFGNNRYVFDHAKGEVFRGDGGLQGKMGEYLVDLSTRLQAGEEPRKGSRSMGAKLHMQVTHHTAKGAQALGESMMSYQKVGTVEGIAARNALYQFKASAQEQQVAKLNIKQAELANLNARGNTAGANTLWVMDESSMGGIHDMERYTAMANAIGARVVIQGDEKQHGSVPAGRAFVQLKKSGIKVSVLEQTRRFDNATAQTKEALALVKLGKYGQAMLKLDTREVSEEAFAGAVGKRFVQNYEELKAKGVDHPKVGVVTLTNRDRKAINMQVQLQLRVSGYIGSASFEKGHLDDPKLTAAEQRTVSKLASASVDRLIFRKDYQEIDVKRGDVLVVTDMNIVTNRLTARNSAGNSVEVNPDWHDFFTPARAEKRAYSVGDRVEARAIVRVDGQEIKNGMRGSVLAVDEKSTTVGWDQGPRIVLNNAQVRFVDLAYAHTSFKEQGATNDREIIAVSKVGAKVFNQMAAYVSATRARDNTEIVTSDLKSLIANADKLTIKTVAMEGPTAAGHHIQGGPQESFEEALGRILMKHQAFGEQRGPLPLDKPKTQPIEAVKELKIEKAVVKQQGVERGF